MRLPTQAHIDRTSSGPAAPGPLPAPGGGDQTTIHRNNILHFPDDIEQLFRAHPTSSAAPTGGSVAKAPGDAGLARGRAIAQPGRRAPSGRIAFAALMRIRAVCGFILRTEFVQRPEIFGCVVLIGVFVVLMGAKSSSFIGPAACLTDPIAFALAPDIDATMTVSAGTACSLWVKNTTVSLDKLEVTSPPQHGLITPRGRTGVIYRPERQFRGADAFTFALRTKSDSSQETSLVRVRVNVK